MLYYKQGAQRQIYSLHSGYWFDVHLLRLEIPRLKLFPGSPVVTELINGNCCRGKSEYLKRFVEHLVQIIESRNSDSDVRNVILACRLRNKCRNIIKCPLVDIRIRS